MNSVHTNAKRKRRAGQRAGVVALIGVTLLLVALKLDQVDPWAGWSWAAVLSLLWAPGVVVAAGTGLLIAWRALTAFWLFMRYLATGVKW